MTKEREKEFDENFGFWVFVKFIFWEKNFRFSFFPSTKNKEQDTKEEEEERFLRGSVVVGVTEESERRKREKKERDADASTFIIKKTDWIVVGVIDGAVIITVVIIITIIIIVDERNRGARRETVPLVDDEGKRCASESCERNVCEECSGCFFFQWIQRSVAAAYEQQVHEHEHDVALQKYRGRAGAAERRRR